jgi:hypothetical protein
LFPAAATPFKHWRLRTLSLTFWSNTILYTAPKEVRQGMKFRAVIYIG